MFDSVPSNLPFEPAQKPSNVERPTSNVEGGKEPEDIFAGIKEPATPMDSKKSTMPQVPVRPRSGSRLLVLVGIPLVVIALGVGGWYLYQSFTQGAKISMPKEQPLAATVPSTPEPDNASQTMQNPIPPPDDIQLAASQASIGLLKAQQEMAAAQATSTAATSTEQAVNIPVGEGMGSAVNGTDEDQDGLTDAEEALLGTNPKLKDSDGDGFEDGSETANGYDPAVSGGKLSDSKFLKHETIGTLQIMIPKTWDRRAGPSNSIVIETGTPASFSITLEPFASTQTLPAWLLDKYSGSMAEDYVQDKAKDGSLVIYSKDLTKAWLLSGNTVYSFRYSTNGQAKEFGDLFDVMVKQAEPSK